MIYTKDEKKAKQIAEGNLEINDTHWKCPWCGGRTFPDFNGLTECRKCEIKYLVIVDMDDYHGKGDDVSTQ